MKKINLLVLLIIALLPLRLTADCVLDNTDNLNGFTPDPAGTLFGQNFLACETGMINSIQLNIQSPGVIDFFLVAGDGQQINLQNPYQTFTNVVLNNGVAEFVFDSPFNVVEGNLYSFGLTGTMSTIII